MSLNNLTSQYLDAIEEELHRAVLRSEGPHLSHYDYMMAYHLGWEGDGAGREARGKRIRPLLVLLSNASAGGNWQAALPAAAAVELVHNFSLIHDDVEDNSPTRRGRASLWALWGIPQAINAGDGLFAIAHLAMDRLRKRGVVYERILDVRAIFDRTCLTLTQGQYLDMSFESRLSTSVDEYMTMISGKTAGLISASAAIGATLAGSAAVVHYGTFGRELGLAFQIQDDILGIWGDEALTGKSAESDIATKKKSLPVVYALGQSERLRTLYAAPHMDVPAAIAELEAAGAARFAEQAARQHHEQAMQALQASGASGEAGQALFELAESLLGRAA